MNKFLVILLIVCIIGCAHAFVKRDTPAEGDSMQDTFKKITDSLGELGKELSEKTSKYLDPENIKKEFNQFVDTVRKQSEGLTGGVKKE